MKRPLWLFVILVAGSLAAAQQQSSSQVEWLYYGGDQGGTKYSSLTDIRPDNVHRLQMAWQWKHWETPLEGVRHTSRASSKPRRS